MALSKDGIGDYRPASLADYRARLGVWLDEHAAELAPPFEAPGTVDDHIAQMQRVKAICYRAGWMQFGWPERAVFEIDLVKATYG